MLGDGKCTEIKIKNEKEGGWPDWSPGQAPSKCRDLPKVPGSQSAFGTQLPPHRFQFPRSQNANFHPIHQLIPPRCKKRCFTRQLSEMQAKDDNVIIHGGGGEHCRGGGGVSL